MVSFDGCLSACVNMNIRNTVSLTQIRHRYSTDVSSIYTSFTCGSIYTPIFSHAKTEVRDQCHNLSLFFSYQMDRFWASTPSTWLKKKSPPVSTRFCSSSGLFSNCSARNIKQPKQQMPIIDIEVLNFPHERCFGLICTPFFQWFWGCCLGNDGCWTCKWTCSICWAPRTSWKLYSKWKLSSKISGEETKNDWKKNAQLVSGFVNCLWCGWNRHQFSTVSSDETSAWFFQGQPLDVKHSGIRFSFTNHSTYLRIIIKPQNSRTNRVNSTPHGKLFRNEKNREFPQPKTFLF